MRDKRKWFERYGFFLNKKDFVKLDPRQAESTAKQPRREGKGWEPAYAHLASESNIIRQWILQL